MKPSFIRRFFGSCSRAFRHPVAAAKGFFISRNTKSPQAPKGNFVSLDSYLERKRPGEVLERKFGDLRLNVYNELMAIHPQYEFLPNLSDPAHVQKDYNAYLHSKALIFDADYTPDVPVYYNPELINYYVIRLQMYYSYLAALRVISPLSRAIDFITKEINHNQFGLFERSDDGDGEMMLKKKPIDFSTLKDDPRLKFFNNTEASGDFRDFISTFVQYYFTCGNIYVMPDQKLKSGNGYLDFVLLPPHFVTAELGLDFKAKYYRYRPGVSSGLVDVRTGAGGGTQSNIRFPAGQGANAAQFNERDAGVYAELVIPPTCIVHLKRIPNVLLPIYGVGMVEANEAVFQQYLVLNRQLQHWMENSMHPSAWLENDTAAGIGIFQSYDDYLSKAVEIEAKLTGKFNVGRLGVVPPGMKVTETTGMSSPEDMITTMEYVNRTILQLFHLPSTMWLKTGAELPKYNNLHEQTQMCRETVIKEVLDAIKIVCNKILQFQGLDDKYYFDFVGEALFTPEEIEAKVKASLMTHNEGRKLIGMPEIKDPNADKLLVMSNLTPIEFAGIQRRAIEETEDITPGGDGPEFENEPDDKSLKQVAGARKPHGDDKAVNKSQVAAPWPRLYSMRRREKSWRDTNGGGWASIPEGNVWKAKQAKRDVKKVREDMLRLQKATLKKHGSKVSGRIEKHLAETVHGIMAEFLKEKTAYEALLAKHGKGSAQKARHGDDKGVNVRKFTFSIYDRDDDADGLKEILSDSYSSVGQDALANDSMTLTIAIDSSATKRIMKYVNLDTGDRSVRMTATTRDIIEQALKDSLDNGDTWGAAANNLYKNFAGELGNYVDPESGAVTGTIDSSGRLHDRAECITRTEMSRAYDRAGGKALRDLNVAKSYSLLGCMEPTDEWPCNEENILPEELDDVMAERHPQCTGTIVIGEFNDSFGESEEEE
jgi:hypothetical protein